MSDLRRHLRGHNLKFVPRFVEARREFEQITLQTATRNELVVNQADAHGGNPKLQTTNPKIQDERGDWGQTDLDFDLWSSVEICFNLC